VTGGKGTPLDFVAFHAKGSPSVTDAGHVRMRMGVQLRQIAAAFSIIRSFPEFAKLPVIIGESDPEGCAACSSSVYPQNDYRNGTMFSSYTAASFARKYELADEYGIDLQGVTTWSFTFPDQPYFAGFRSLATRGIDKPVLNVFRMFGLMGGDRVAVRREQGYTARTIIEHGVVTEPDINALASRDGNRVSILVWNYHDDDLPTLPAPVRLAVSNLPAGRALVQHYRIDERHSNAYAAWLELGAPQQLSAGQRERLEAAGKLALLGAPAWVDVKAGTAVLEFRLPHQGVSLVQLSW